jgi:SAM-dependent methyltransferase
VKRDYPATQRNRDPILDVLRRVLPREGHVLEIASGTGQHAQYFSEKMPKVRWQPSDQDPAMLDSIRAYRDERASPNLLPPVTLDVLNPWPVSRVDAVFCANMIHIAPWPCTEALFRGSRRALPRGAALILYGPFMLGGAHTSPSNLAFDNRLREQDAEWGVRDLDKIRSLSVRYALDHEETIQMPAHNLCAIFRRR